MVAILARRGLFVASLVALLLIGCDRGSDGGGPLSVLLTEWSVTVSREEGSAGGYSLEVINHGSRTHQLIVIKSDLPPLSLPASEGRIEENLVKVALKLDPLAPGERRVVETELGAGKYVLVCNLVENTPGNEPEPHYLNGMAASFLIDQ